MKHLAPKRFRAFACAAGACPDSCCRAGWEIVIDPDTCELYRTLCGPAAERVRAGIVYPGRGAQCAPADSTTPDAEPLLRQDGNRVCVLLDSDGLCHVQRNFGHEALCRVCREYPRFHREFGNLTEHGLSLSCPTAYALAVSAPLEWETWEDEAPVVPNELDPEAYLRLRRGRELALALLAREELPLGRRIQLLRRLAASMQAAPERQIHHDYALRLRRWETAAAVGAAIGRPPEAPGGRMQNAKCIMHNEGDGGRGLPRRCAHWLAMTGSETAATVGAHSVRQRGTCPLSPVTCHLDRLAERFAGLEILSPAWGERLAQLRAHLKNRAGAQCAPLRGTRTAECRPYVQGGAGAQCAPLREPWETDTPEVYARYLAFSLYKYWLDALDDGNLLGRVERSISMTLLGLAMDQAFPGEGPFLQRISREIEHCEENLAALLRA